LQNELVELVELLIEMQPVDFIEIVEVALSSSFYLSHHHDSQFYEFNRESVSIVKLLEKGEGK